MSGVVGDQETKEEPDDVGDAEPVGDTLPDRQPHSADASIINAHPMHAWKQRLRASIRTTLSSVLTFWRYLMIRANRRLISSPAPAPKSHFSRSPNQITVAGSYGEHKAGRRPGPPFSSLGS